MTEERKPKPVISSEGRRFWEGCREGVLRLQRCSACSEVQWFPRQYCRKCGSDALGWFTASGRGRLHSYSTVYRAMSPAFARDLPYVFAIIELDEGIRVVSNLVECDPKAVQIDMPVEVVFEKLDDEVAVPKFRPAGGGA